MADLTLPVTGVVGVGAVGTIASTDVNAGTVTKALSGVVGVGARGSVSYGESFGLSGTSAVGRVGASITVSEGPFQGLTMAMPGFQLVLTGVLGDVASLELDWPAFTLGFTGVTAETGALALDWPAPTLAITGVTGTTGSLDLRFPHATLAFGAGNNLSMEMPSLQLALTGTTGVVGALSLNLPHWALALTGTAHAAGVLVLNFPALRMAIAGDSGRAARLAMTMKAMQLALTGTTGGIGTLELDLPIFQLDIAGSRDAAGSLSLLVPAFRLQIAGGTVLAAGESEANATTLVMQTERGALTHYTNYPFNSFAAFNGVFLGASDDGVFALTGSDDAGAAIAAVARTGATDFGTSHLKRVERIYVGYRSTGRMILRVITEERWTRDYALVPVNHPGLHGAHVRLGRGLEARYWQFELQNYEGGDFDMDMMEMKPIKLKRRVGSGNA